MLRGTYLRTGNPNAGGVNRSSLRPEAFSFSSVVSSSHARASRPCASSALSICITHAFCCTSYTCGSASSATSVTPLLCRK